MKSMPVGVEFCDAPSSGETCLASGPNALLSCRVVHRVERGENPKFGTTDAHHHFDAKD